MLSGGIAGAVVSAVWNFVSGLLLQRDQAASTKELTELKDDLDRAQKRVQAELDRSVFVTRVHFETEFEAMKNVFAFLSQVRLAMISLRPMVRVEPATETEQPRLQRQCERLDDLSVAYNKLLTESEARTPFYVVELYQAIEGCLRAAFLSAACFLGIPVKVNIDSGGKPNGTPERR
jgi:hypothetical protein